MRTWILFALSALPLCAQFSGFSSTYDGQELYFSSQLLLATQDPVKTEYRIFHLRNGQVDLFAQRDLTAPGALNGGGSSDGANGAQVSDDGLTVAYTVTGQCIVPNSCTPTFSTGGSLAFLRGPGGKTLGPGIVAMSKNAKWAVISNQAGPNTTLVVNGVPVQSAPESVLVNLVTSERTTLPEPVASFFRAGAVVASDGTVMLSGAQGPGLWKSGNFIPLIASGGIGLQMLSDNGRMLVYSQLVVDPLACAAGVFCFPKARLIVRDSWNGIDNLIATDASTALGISNDGHRLLYRNSPANPNPALSGPVFIANVVGGDSIPIPLPDGEIAVDGTLSGDGNTAFLATSKGRIVSVDLLHGMSQHTLVASTPYVLNTSLWPAGSLLRLTGLLPTTLDAVKGKILLNNVPVPVLYANASEVGIQVPWEPLGPATLKLDLASDSPFRQVAQLTVGTAAPRLEGTPADQPDVMGILAVKGDFSGLVTTNPSPGDVFVTYATGLGPVLNHPPTGQPTPTDRLYPTQLTVSCRFLPYTLPAETLFAGLAPGLIGVYQINFKMPPGVNLGAVTGGQCNFSGSGFGGSAIWSRLTTPLAP